MELFTKMISHQIQLLLLLIIGVIVKKTMKITDGQQKGMTNILINVILPASILSSFIGSSVDGVLKNLVLVLVVSTIIQISASLTGPVLFRFFPESKSHVMTYGMIVSNSSFIGIPIAEIIYGNTAVMMASVFQIPIRITMWTAGLSLFTKDNDVKSKVRKMVTHPCIVAVFVGLILMIFRINVPIVVSSTVTSLARCTTGISMMIIGMILADIKVSSCFSFDALYFSFIRLIFYPLVVLGIMKLLQMDELLISLVVIMTAMPAGSTTAILAKQYGYDSEYAAKIVLVSTLLSMATIPLICLLI